MRGLLTALQFWQFYTGPVDSPAVLAVLCGACWPPCSSGYCSSGYIMQCMLVTLQFWRYYAVLVGSPAVCTAVYCITRIHHGALMQCNIANVVNGGRIRHQHKQQGAECPQDPYGVLYKQEHCHQGTQYNNSINDVNIFCGAVLLGLDWYFFEYFWTLELALLILLLIAIICHDILPHKSYYTRIFIQNTPLSPYTRHQRLEFQ